MTPEIEITDYDVAEAMAVYGGSFIKNLAGCVRTADAINLAKIKATWPEYWATYTNIALKTKSQPVD
jgi:hypothetical protein